MRHRLTLEQYEQRLADKKGMTVERLRAELAEENAAIYPCREGEACDYGECCGWIVMSKSGWALLEHAENEFCGEHQEVA